MISGSLKLLLVYERRRARRDCTKCSLAWTLTDRICIRHPHTQPHLPLFVCSIQMKRNTHARSAFGEACFSEVCIWKGTPILFECFCFQKYRSNGPAITIASKAAPPREIPTISPMLRCPESENKIKKNDRRIFVFTNTQKTSNYKFPIFVENKVQRNINR